MLRTIQFTVIAMILMISSSAQADEFERQYNDALRNSVVFAQTNRWDIGANYWNENLSEFDSPDDILTTDLAFLYVVHSIFLERSNNDAAYYAWTNALSLFLNNGVSWEHYRNSLAAEIESVEFQISSSFSASGIGISGASEKALILKSLNDLVAFTTYDGPRPGLAKKNETDEETFTIARSYFPRPFSDAGEEAAVENRLRTNESPELEVDPDNAAIARGVVPVANDETDQLALLQETQILAPPENSDPASIAPDNTNINFADPAPPQAHPVTQVTVEDLSNIPVTDGLDSFRTIIARRHVLEERVLLPEEEVIARRAWRYFTSNRQSNTGLFNSVHNYPYTTMWDMGSSLAALYCAYQLAVIDEITFNEQLSLLLSTLASIPLYDNALPNREYDTRTGLMTNLKNLTDETGSGFSSLDIGRTLTWLAVIKESIPEYSDTIDAIVSGWRLSRTTDNGELHRELIVSDRVDRKQEGRFGYEQYAALAFAYWGVQLPNALSIDEISLTDVGGISIYIDTRTPDYMNLEPFLLLVMEYSSYPNIINTQLNAMIEAHSLRYENKAVLSLLAEDSIDQEPWFLYNVIADKNETWLCKTGRNTVSDYCQSLSTKAAFASSVIFDYEFLEEALGVVSDKFSPRYGYYAGVYEDGAVNEALTANTNALILESLLFKQRGTAFLDREHDEQLQRSRSRLAN